MPGAGGHRGSIQHGMQPGSVGGQSRSPVKESSYLARTASVDEVEEQSQEQEDKKNEGFGEGSSALGDNGPRDQQPSTDLDEMRVSPPPMKEGLPIRR